MNSPLSTIAMAEHDRAEFDRALQHSYALCRQVTRTRARNFYYGLRFTPGEMRHAMYALYAWSRAADDLADDERNETDSREALAEFRRLTDAAADFDHSIRMRETKPTIWPAVAETISAYRIPRDYFLDLIDRQIEDLAVRCRPNFESLYSYCYGVASTVGMMCVTVWGNRSERALVLAEKRGIAMQLTNILRDFLEDHGRGRVYLPIDDFERFGLTPVDLAHWSRPSVCEAMVQFQVARAESYFQESDALESILEPRCARTSWIMMRLYRTMLDRIQREPNRIVRPETIRLSTPRKIAIVAHSFLRGRNREP